VLSAFLAGVAVNAEVLSVRAPYGVPVFRALVLFYRLILSAPRDPQRHYDRHLGEDPRPAALAVGECA
jgi:hypothetical protein